MPRGKYIQEEDTGRLAGSEAYPFSRPVRLSQEVADTVGAYVGDTYNLVNPALRDDEPIPMEDAEQVISGLDEAIQSQQAIKDMVVVRAVHESVVQKLRPGKTMIDHAYLSTSMDRVGLETVIANTRDPETGEPSTSRPAIMEISVDKGTPLLDVSRGQLRGKDVQRFQSGPDEKEILFGRGTRLKITSIEKTGRSTVIRAKLSYGDRRDPQFAEEDF